MRPQNRAILKPQNPRGDKPYLVYSVYLVCSVYLVYSVCSVDSVYSVYSVWTVLRALSKELQARGRILPKTGLTEIG